MGRRPSPGRDEVELTGRSWSGAAAVDRVDVSVDGGATWKPARPYRSGHRQAWTQWRYAWKKPLSASTC